MAENQPRTCDRCGGSGQRTLIDRDGNEHTVPCPRCNGTGKIDD